MQRRDRSDIVMLRCDVTAEAKTKGRIIGQARERLPNIKELPGGKFDLFAPVAEQPAGEAGQLTKLFNIHPQRFETNG